MQIRGVGFRLERSRILIREEQDSDQSGEVFRIGSIEDRGGEGCMEKADRFQGLYWIQVGMEYIYELRLDMITVQVTDEFVLVQGGVGFRNQLTI